MNKKDNPSMLRKHQIFIIITSLITLLPILIGILCWSRLPDTIATHFASDGTPALALRHLLFLGFLLLCAQPIFSVHFVRRSTRNIKI